MVEENRKGGKEEDRKMSEMMVEEKEGEEDWFIVKGMTVEE